MRRGTLLKSLLVTTLGTVGVLELEPKLSSSLSSEKEKDRILGEGFLETQEVETLLEEHLTIQQVWNLLLG